MQRQTAGHDRRRQDDRQRSGKPPAGNGDKAVEQRKEQVQNEYQRDIPNHPLALRPKGNGGKIAQKRQPPCFSQQDIKNQPARAADHQIGRQYAHKALAVKIAQARIARQRVEQSHSRKKEKDLHTAAAQRKVIYFCHYLCSAAEVCLLHILEKVKEDNGDDGKTEQLAAHVRKPGCDAFHHGRH